MQLTTSLAGRQAPDCAEVLDRRLDPDSAAPVAVAFSGGSDSLYLLLAAAAWARGVGRPLLALHVDHQLQPQSGAWAEQARRTALGLGAGFRRLDWTGSKPSTGLPAAARAARLGLLAQAAREAEACAILLGHTADDVLEADVMRHDGLRLGYLHEWSPSPVWPEGRGVFHCRPLLGRRRADLRQGLGGSGHGWVEDPANVDLRSPRARARRRLSVNLATQVPAGRPDGTPAPAALVKVDAGGGAVLARGAVDRRLLAAVLACVSGREAPARPDRLAALAARLTSGEAFTGALGGCRVEAEPEDVLVSREAGEWRRAGRPEIDLSPHAPVVWDGRFEITATEPGWRVCPLQGLAARLPPDQADRLRHLPPAVRAALPAAVNEAHTVTCPILASGPVLARGLVRGRLLGACGHLTCESDVAAATHGADEPDVLSSGGSLKKAWR